MTCGLGVRRCPYDLGWTCGVRPSLSAGAPATACCRTAHSGPQEQSPRIELRQLIFGALGFATPCPYLKCECARIVSISCSRRPSASSCAWRSGPAPAFLTKLRARILRDAKRHLERPSRTFPFDRSPRRSAPASCRRLADDEQCPGRIPERLVDIRSATICAREAVHVDDTVFPPTADARTTATSDAISCRVPDR